MVNKHTGKRKEDYLEAILILSKNAIGVRAREIASNLNLNKSTIVPMIEKLAREGLVKHEKYGDIILTPRGIEKAQEVYKKHLGMFSFLKNILKIPTDIAQVDACNLEHYISDKTIEKLIKFVEFFRIKVARNNRTFKQLEEYYETGNYVCEKHALQNIVDLSHLKKNDTAIILKINSTRSVKNSYFLIGVQPGVTIKVVSINITSGNTDENYITIQQDNEQINVPCKDCKNILVEKV